MAVCPSCASLRSRPCWLIVVLSATQGRVLSRSWREGCLDQKRQSHILLTTQFDGKQQERIPLLGSIFR
ncbi:hypothetical protein GOP47_0005376 [Adiantum capillus-veneris]|uniref:Secreted protein n=1 Tax=Adiantum capillus-veneris TaxID=13818 RepID=A0A9D4ZN66_ADICA|nr:hypothetical protein GOP47_0005376 [Adiantum capillus-veneris]